MPLKRARELCVDIKRAAEDKAAAVPTFSDIAERWYASQIAPRSASTQIHTRAYLNKEILPALGSYCVSDITPALCLDICQRICDEGHLTAARLVRQLIVRILDFAVIAGHIPANPAAAIRRVLPAPPERHFGALSAPEDIAVLLARISTLRNYIVRVYINTLIYTFTRPSELRCAEWREISGDVWTIPAERMKARRAHVVPLAPQVKTALEELREKHYSDRYLFPATDGSPIWAQVAIYALRQLGYGPGTVTLHGFRAMASTALNSAGFAPDVIEAQLAHVERNKTRRAYNRAEYMPQRVEMMKFWADYLSGLAGEKQ